MGAFQSTDHLVFKARMLPQSLLLPYEFYLWFLVTTYKCRTYAREQWHSANRSCFQI